MKIYTHEYVLPLAKTWALQKQITFLNLEVFQTLGVYAEYIDYPECTWKGNTGDMENLFWDAAVVCTDYH